ncbi:MAG: phosphotransferase [Candidatus Hodarchaeales archaeon]|jgi:thiamine kinase-like enzyme
MRAEINKQFLEENKIIEKIKSLFLDEYGIKVIDIQPLGQGVGSVVLKIVTSEKKYAIKICMYPERSEKVISEFSIRKDLNKFGFEFVPESLCIDRNVFEYGAVVFDYVESISIDFTDKKILSKLAQTLSKLHAHSFKKIPDGYKVLQDHFSYLKELVDKTVTNYDYIINEYINQGMKLALLELDSYLVSKRTKFTHGLIGLCHDDVASNLIIDPNEKIWLVDWENSCIGDIVDEIVSTTFGLNLDKKLSQYFYNSYQEVFPPAKNINFLEIGDIYLEMGPIYDICWGLDFLDTNLKRGLQPEFYFNEIKKQLIEIKSKFSSKTYDYFEKGIKNININSLLSQKIDR